MVDIEPEVFTRLSNSLRTSFPGITVLPETILAPSRFPCVCVEEIDNYTKSSTVDSSGENHANVVYEVNVYSDKQSGKKSECKTIFAALDEIFSNLGFIRSMKNPSAMNDPTKHRLIGRYKAVVSENKTVYRR